MRLCFFLCCSIGDASREVAAKDVVTKSRRQYDSVQFSRSDLIWGKGKVVCRPNS